MLSLILCAALAGAGPRPLLISTDIGSGYDDPWAVAHLALARDRFDVRAVVTSHSPDIKPPIAENAAEALRAVLKRLPGKPVVEVAEGAEVPLSKLPRREPSPGAKRLLAESRRLPAGERLTVAMLGPATDVALALEADPTVAARIEVVALGFDGWPKGGDPYNVKHDVEAWRILLDSETPITVVDLAVTTRDLGLRRDDLKKRFAPLGSTGKALVDEILAFLDRDPALAKRLSGSADRATVWDEGVTAVLLGYARLETRARPRLRSDGTFDHSAPKGTLCWATAIDAPKLWDDLEARLRGVAAAASMP